MGNSSFTELVVGKLFLSMIWPNSSNSSSPFKGGLLGWVSFFSEFAGTVVAGKKFHINITHLNTTAYNTTMKVYIYTGYFYDHGTNLDRWCRWVK